MRSLKEIKDNNSDIIFLVLISALLLVMIIFLGLTSSVSEHEFLSDMPYHGTISVGSTVNGCTLEDVYNIISVKEDNGDIIVYDEDGDTINVNIGNVYIVDNNIDTRLELWTNKGDKVYYLYATRDEIPY